jgi:hypothetical protein
MEGDWKVANNAGMIIDLDKKRMRAMAAKDTATLLADDLVYTHSSARLDTKQSLIANMKSGATVYSAVDPSEVWAQDLGDAVILTGVAQIKEAKRSLADGCLAVDSSAGPRTQAKICPLAWRSADQTINCLRADMALDWA